MPDDHTPYAPAASEAGAVFDNLSEADASAVLESLSAPAADTSRADESALSSSLDEALEGADLTKMSDAQVADFESGDPERVQAALAAVQQQPPAQQTAEDGASSGAPARISIKALKPEDRARTVQALDLIRAGRAPAEAFGEVFGITSQPHSAEREAADFAQDAYASYETSPNYSDITSRPRQPTTPPPPTSWSR
jgi:hypothetical protein